MSHKIFYWMSCLLIIGYILAPKQAKASLFDSLKVQKTKQEQQLQSIDNELLKLQDELKISEENISAKQTQNQNLQREIDRLLTQRDTTLSRRNELLVAIYEMRSGNGLPLIMHTIDLTDFSNGLEFMASIEEELTHAINDAFTASTELIEKQSELNQQTNALLAYHRNQQQNVTNIEKMRDEANDKLQGIDAELVKISKSSQPLVLSKNVHKGDVIGYMGSTGFCYNLNSKQWNGADCAHLHFEVISQYNRVDPREFVPNKFKWPFNSFSASQEFGANWVYKDGQGHSRSAYGTDGHTGLDLISSEGYGTPVLAAESGVLIELWPEYKGWMGEKSGYGCYKVIDHGEGVMTLYGHLTPNSCGR